MSSHLTGSHRRSADNNSRERNPRNQGVSSQSNGTNSNGHPDLSSSGVASGKYGLAQMNSQLNQIDERTSEGGYKEGLDRKEFMYQEQI